MRHEVYTRKEAVDEGLIVDLSSLSFVCSVYYTHPVHCSAEAWSLIRRAQAGSFLGLDAVIDRILAMSVDMHLELDESTYVFAVRLDGVGRRPHCFKIICGPGDSGPVLTLAMAYEF